MSKLHHARINRFSNHVAAQPLCGPSRASLLAGRYPHNTGYKSNDDAKSVLAWALQQDNTGEERQQACGILISPPALYLSAALFESNFTHHPCLQWARG